MVLQVRYKRVADLWSANKKLNVWNKRLQAENEQ